MTSTTFVLQHSRGVVPLIPNIWTRTVIEHVARGLREVKVPVALVKRPFAWVNQ